MSGNSASVREAANGRSLRALLAGFADVRRADDRVIESITLDSRNAVANSLFVALPGQQHDGRAFIDAAIDAGAVAVVYDPQGLAAPPAIRSDIPAYAIDKLRDHLGELAKRLYDDVSARLLVVGVTGTNGKTSCVWTLVSALNNLGINSAMLGTLGFGRPGDINGLGLTTPDVFSVHLAAAMAYQDHARVFALELSSHGLDQGRADGLDIDVAVFTNLTHDHLDYHGDMRRYGEAKAVLFGLPSVDVAIINADDPWADRLRQRAKGKRVINYGYDGGDVCCRETRCHAGGLDLHLVTPLGDLHIRSPQIGRFNAANLAAVAGVLIALADDLGLSAADIERGLSSCVSPPGRMEIVKRQSGPTVVVDFAHTPDALKHALEAVHEHASGKVSCVFGCGGDRDADKRPLMGRLAEQYADHVVLTNDNPRRESPQAIVDAIQRGMSRPAQVVLDRKHAITTAIANAEDDDWVLIAGKGHEQEQIVDGQRLPFSDQDAAREALIGIGQ